MSKKQVVIVLVCLVGLGGGVWWLVDRSSRSWLESTLEAQDERRAALLAELDPARPVVLGESLEKNAAAAYLAVEADWTEGSRESTDEDGPTLAEMRHVLKARDGMVDYPEDDAEAYLEGESAEMPEALASFRNEHLPGVLERLRGGVRASVCDWDVASHIDAGPDAWLPSPVVVREVAGLLAVEAHRSEDVDRAIELGLLAVAYGLDIQRHPSFLGVRSGEVAVDIGLRSLVRTLDGKEPGAGPCRRLAGRLRALDGAGAWSNETATRVYALAVTDHYARVVLAGEDPWGSTNPPLAYRLSPAYWAAAELGSLHAWSSRAFESLAAPPVEGYPAAQELAADLEETDSWLTRMVLPNPGHLVAGPTDARARLRAAVVLAEASAVRAETGSWPSDRRTLVEAVGEEAVPADPWAPDRPTRYEADDGSVRAFSIGTDGEPNATPTEVEAYELQEDRGREIGLFIGE